MLLGYSRAAFAELIGVTHSAVYNWEVRGRSPRAESIFKICQAMDLPLSVFLKPSEVQRAPSQLQHRKPNKA